MCTGLVFNIWLGLGNMFYPTASQALSVPPHTCEDDVIYGNITTNNTYDITTVFSHAVTYNSTEAPQPFERHRYHNSFHENSFKVPLVTV